MTWTERTKADIGLAARCSRSLVKADSEEAEAHHEEGAGHPEADVEHPAEEGVVPVVEPRSWWSRTGTRVCLWPGERRICWLPRIWWRGRACMGKRGLVWRYVDRAETEERGRGEGYWADTRAV